jgi:glycerate kinase
MKILVASDKFKGSLTAPEACGAIATGLREGSASRPLEIQTLPIADGGDGIAETMLAARGGRWVECEVAGPLGNPVKAGYALLGDGRSAVIEMAKASGIALLGERANDPLRASTYGTGQLIRDAIGRGVTGILLGIGGSATNDGGTGMAEALGFRFENAAGNTLTGLPEGLEHVARILPPDKATFPAITVACDVTNPLLGERGCTRVYGPQKGIVPAGFALHEDRLAHLVALTGAHGQSLAESPGSGAAGGLGFGAMVFLGATLASGFDYVSEQLGLAAAIAEADLVITGEGRLDSQSLQGKGPYGVVRLARSLGKETAAFCGSLEDRTLESEFGPITEIRDPDRSLGENLAAGADLLRDAAKRFALHGLAGLP